MADAGDFEPEAPVDRSERHGHIGWVLLLAGVLVGSIIGLRFVTSEQAQPLILGLLAFFAMAGVFFLFAAAIGVIQFAGQGTRNDLTKMLADTSAEGMIVVADEGRVVYANAAYLALAGHGGGDVRDVRTVERLFTGAPDVSEAIYRLAQAGSHRQGWRKAVPTPRVG